MRKNKLKCIVLGIIFFSILFIMNKAQATGSVSLSSNKSSVYVGDEFSISVNLSGASAATLTTKISVDTSKVDYVSGPSNSNFSGGRVIYTWTDPNGGSSPTSGNIATFKFRAKATGKASFTVSGDFFDSDENSLRPSFSGTSVTVSEKTVTPPSTGGSTGGNTGGTGGSSGTTGGNQGGSGGNQGSTSGGTTGGSTSSGTTGNKPSGGSSGGSNSGNTGGNNNAQSTNANLKSLHLNVEGLSPAFNKNTTNYYIVVPEAITSINVVAEPEDSNAKVSISGNNNLSIGNNTITIAVTAPNDKNKKTYTINVTRTNNPDNANANLLNLAIENVTLEPEFNKDITQYNVQIGSEQDSLNILAVPEIEGANVDIQGKDNLQFGNNTVTIKVTAKDGTTVKEYIISVYRKTLEEEQNEIMLLDEDVDMEGERNDTTNEEKKAETSKLGIAVFFVIVITSLGGVIFMVLRRYFKEKK